MAGEGDLDFAEIEKQLNDKESEIQMLRSQSLGYQNAAETGFMPKNDSNIIEYKLSSEELLERIEHYLRGDILKSRFNNEEKTTEYYYAPPTKRISVTLFRDPKTERIYTVDEHPNLLKTKEAWNILSVFEREKIEDGKGNEVQGNLVETYVEENYKPFLLDELTKALSRKKDPAVNIGFASKEVSDNEKKNLNDYGVQEIMNILSVYISKETFLANYREDRVMKILNIIGHKVNLFFLTDRERIGLRKEKRDIIIFAILNQIENAYTRALGGQENKGSREGVIVTRHESDNKSPFSVAPPKKRWSPLDRSTW